MICFSFNISVLVFFEALDYVIIYFCFLATNKEGSIQFMLRIPKNQKIILIIMVIIKCYFPEST